jgi:hypothetical protein
MVGMRRLADPCHGYATPRSRACQHVPRSQIRVTAMAVAGWPGQDNACGAQWLRHAFLGESPQTFLETGGKVGVDGRLSFGAAAGRLGAWHLGFADAERAIQEQAGVGIAGASGHHLGQGVSAGGREPAARPEAADSSIVPDSMKQIVRNRNYDASHGSIQ